MTMAFLRLIWNKIEWIHKQIVFAWKIAVIHLSLNIDFLKKSSPFWLIYLPFLVRILILKNKTKTKKIQGLKMVIF